MNNNDNISSPVFFSIDYQCPTCTLKNFLSWSTSVHDTFFSNHYIPKIVIVGDFN